MVIDGDSNNEWLPIWQPEPSFDTLKSAQTRKTLISKKVLQKLKKCSSNCCFILLEKPHVQTAGSPRILATYPDTITLCLGSRYLGSPQPTSWFEFTWMGRTRHSSYWIPTLGRQTAVVPVHFLNCAPFARNCALIVRNCAPIARYQVVQKVKKKVKKSVKPSSFELGRNVHPPQAGSIN